jgi:hypothetical protein
MLNILLFLYFLGQGKLKMGHYLYYFLKLKLP